MPGGGAAERARRRGGQFGSGHTRRYTGTMQSPIDTATTTLPIAHQGGSLGLAVTHLNASTGPLLTTEQLAASLRAGSAAALAGSPAASALVRYLPGKQPE